MQAFGARLGDFALVLNLNDASRPRSAAILADVGPEGKLGNRSIALATALALPLNPRRAAPRTGWSTFRSRLAEAASPAQSRRSPVRESASWTLSEEWKGSKRACGDE
jgi:hypothetical protein